ncbi:hypothetical protein KKG41_03270 [Patescibacteria group bacterium]|nr:hypothetical protein [Patescibacteria group bacterium]MBU1890093.1 hypothetical protein [Patescibacteria group bacterium]
MTIRPPYSLGYAWFTKKEITKLGSLAYEHGKILERYWLETDNNIKIK